MDLMNLTNENLQALNPPPFSLCNFPDGSKKSPALVIYCILISVIWIILAIFGISVYIKRVYRNLQAEGDGVDGNRKDSV
jgi:hypothetical protein